MWYPVIQRLESHMSCQNATRLENSFPCFTAFNLDKCLPYGPQQLHRTEMTLVFRGWLLTFLYIYLGPV